MGRMQREKGKRFERDIAARLREFWPDAVIRRASQAERADNPDVFVEGGPPVLARLWLELQDARRPTPEVKLEQAEDDACGWLARRPFSPSAQQRYPVVVWHELGARSVHVSTRMWVLGALVYGIADVGSMVMVTLGLDDFLEILRRAA